MSGTPARQELLAIHGGPAVRQTLFALPDGSRLTKVTFRLSWMFYAPTG